MKTTRLLKTGLLCIAGLLFSQVLWAADEIFTAKTTEGITMTFQRIGSTNTCRVYGKYENGSYIPAIDNLTTGKVTIPNTAGGYTVTEIGSYAFYYCSGITSLTMPTTVKEIQSAFYGCTSLAEVIGINNVEYIYSGFEFSSTPWEKNFPEGPIYLGKVLYTYKGDMPEGTILQVKDGTVSIAYQALHDLNGLEGVVIPQSVTEIDGLPFYNCYNLRSIVVSSANANYDSRGNCNAIIRKSDNCLITGCSATSIPSTVKTINSDAFWGNGQNNLYSYTIPNTVETLGSYAFGNQTNLRRVTIGSGVKSIRGSAFYYCTNLKAIHSLIDSPFEINVSVFPTTVYETATLYVPAGTKVNYASTPGWNQFKKIVETDGSTLLDGDVFTYSSFTYCITSAAEKTCELIGIPTDASGRITIPSTANGYRVTAIADNALYQRKGVTTVTIPTSVTSIGLLAFFKCEGLTSLTIPSSVTSLGERFTLACTGLTSLNVREGNPVYDSREDCNAIIETATNTLVAGCAASVIPSTVEALGPYAFARTTLKGITLPTALKTIGHAAFWKSPLVDITIPASVDSIGEYAFNAYDSLVKITSLIAEPFEISTNVFSTATYEQATLYVPKGTLEDYESTAGWSSFVHIEELGAQPETPDDPDEPVLLGDVNGDGEVNGTDIVAMANIILGREDEVPAADMNGSGTVDGTDLVMLVDAVLGRNSKAPRRMPTRVAATTAATLSIEPFSIKAGEEQEMVVNLNNPADELTLVQFDLRLPEGLHIKTVTNNELDIDMTDRTTWRRHTLDANLTDDAWRFLLYSSSNTLINGTEGGIIKVRLVADETFDGGTIAITNALLVGPNLQETKPSAYEYRFIIPGSAILSVEPFSIKSGEERDMLIDLTNPKEEITLVQFDLRLPEGLTVCNIGDELDINIAGRTTWRNHILDGNRLDGVYRILLYSNSNATISGNEGAIIRIHLKANERFDNENILLENVLLVSPDLRESRTETVVGISTTMEENHNVPLTINALDGRRLSAPARGVNLLHMSDGTTRKVLVK